jgi:hypothetical protein
MSALLPTKTGQILRIRKAATPEKDAAELYHLLRLPAEVIKPLARWTDSQPVSRESSMPLICKDSARQSAEAGLTSLRLVKARRSTASGVSSSPPGSHGELRLGERGWPEIDARLHWLHNRFVTGTPQRPAPACRGHNHAPILAPPSAGPFR